MSLSPAHYSINLFNPTSMLFPPLSLVGTAGVIQGGETKIWSITLKAEQRNRVFEKRVLKKMPS
jgi:hypothetical protein